MVMKRFRSHFAWLALALFLNAHPSLALGADSAGPAAKLRVLLVYGGHAFETNQFFQMFKDNPDIALQTVEHPQAHAWLKPDAARQYDVLVLYDSWPKIGEDAKADFVQRLKDGKGLVALHHSLCNYPKWDEYAKIVGGQYHFEKWTANGVEQPASTYRHDVRFSIRVADPNHPVTRGVKDFDLLDETYGGFEVRPESHALLTTSEATSGRTIAWAKTYEQARVVYLQSGHDHTAYENPNYRRLVAQAIRWVARKD